MLSVDDIPDLTITNDGVVMTVSVTVTDTESASVGTPQACGAYAFSLNPTNVVSTFDYGASTIDFSGTIVGDHSQILTVSIPSRPSVTPVATSLFTITTVVSCSATTMSFSNVSFDQAFA